VRETAYMTTSASYGPHDFICMTMLLSTSISVMRVRHSDRICYSHLGDVRWITSLDAICLGGSMLAALLDPAISHLLVCNKHA
jgi:hypothetical protein